jgi:hypothetical protein
MRKLFRRRAFYSEVWGFDQVVVADDEGASEGMEFAFQGEGGCVDSEFSHVVEDVEEVSPDDLDDAEARAVADYLAEGAEYEPLKQRSVQEVRRWIDEKLRGERQEEEGR